MIKKYDPVYLDRIIYTLERERGRAIISAFYSLMVGAMAGAIPSNYYKY